MRESGMQQGGSRAAILARLRAARRCDDQTALARLDRPVLGPMAGGGTDAPLLERFCARARACRGEVLHEGVSAPLAMLPAALALALERSGFPLRDGGALTVDRGSSLARLSWPQGLEVSEELADGRCHLGVLEASVGCAETGGVVLTSRRSMRLGFAPEILVVVVSVGSVVERWEEALALADVGSVRSLCAVHGPSRTRDVERIAVFGAHGPRMLWLYVCEEALP